MMGKSDLPKRSLYRPAPALVLTRDSGVETKPATAAVPKPKPKAKTADRHAPGYMAEYMRKRRAKAR